MSNVVATSTSGICDVQFLTLPVILLLAALVLVIVVLLFFIVYYRRRLKSTREALVRYISIYLSVKDYVPSDRLPVVNRMKDSVTPDEFIQIINRMLKRMMLLPLVAATVLGCSIDTFPHASHPDKGPVLADSSISFRPSDQSHPKTSQGFSFQEAMLSSIR